MNGDSGNRTPEKVTAEQPRKHSRWRNARTGKLVTVIDLWEFVGLGRHVSVRYEESERRRTYSTERFRSEFTEVGPHD